MLLNNDEIIIFSLTAIYVLAFMEHTTIDCGWLAVCGGREVSRYVLADTQTACAGTNCMHVQPGVCDAFVRMRKHVNQYGYAYIEALCK